MYSDKYRWVRECVKTGSAEIETMSLFSSSRPIESRQKVNKEYLWHGLTGLVFAIVSYQSWWRRGGSRVG